MKYNRLGSTGLIVSALCLGTNTFGGKSLPFWSKLGGLDQREVDAIVKAAVDAGINFLDTADSYAAGESEGHVGRAVRNLGLAREDIVIATKFGGRVRPGPNSSGASRKHLVHATEQSLQRLELDHVDLLMVHVFDPATPLEETLRALDDLVRAGKVRYIGCSNFSAWELMKALGISTREGLHRFEVVESHWSLAERYVERELVPLCNDQKVGFLAWGPLVGGLLTGKYARDGSGPAEGRTGGAVPPVIDRERLFDIVDVLRKMANRLYATPSQLALSWLLHQQAATSVLFGCKSVEQLRDNVKATDLRLSPEDLAELDEISRPLADYGSWMVRDMRGERAAMI